jgi:hypothetical protein
MVNPQPMRSGNAMVQAERSRAMCLDKTLAAHHCSAIGFVEGFPAETNRIGFIVANMLILSSINNLFNIKISPRKSVVKQN